MWTFPYCPNKGDFAINWRELENKFEWLRVLADCPQDARYHEEGDVLTHTKLVCEALIALPQWQALPEIQRSMLFAGALLHDVAKPKATKIEDSGAISSKGHVLQGAKMAQEILWDLNVPFQQREEIVSLVKYGSLPLWFWDKLNPQKAVIKASQIIRCDMLAMLAEADVRGRYCNDQNQLFERIDFFREFCRENNCFSQPRLFPSAHSRFIYFQKENGNPDYHAYDDTRFQVVIMSGLPGSGKDTWIQENLPEYKVISLDDLRREMGIKPGDNQGEVANAAKYLAKEYMRTGVSFVWNATNLNKQLRGMLIRLFAAYQADIRIVYLETSWSNLLKRNKTRTDKVPEKVLYRMKNRLEVPTIIEAHRVDWIAS
ncbi:putative domain HDIG-containing protein [Rivularia sp. PCC 7116]|uniref:AAA family ATPase n=1 Tax=Rivularia sp. PCC 7116 TaxID=373994 RepID=UPI00029EC4DB|nr:AAA family ATPase [Rivularia sp. PCC 7116]AFY57963.1 putative domain HDIG-containing protein [Rivularia sp. PCC 7116]